MNIIKPVGASDKDGLPQPTLALLQAMKESSDLRLFFCGAVKGPFNFADVSAIWKHTKLESDTFCIDWGQGTGWHRLSDIMALYEIEKLEHASHDTALSRGTNVDGLSERVLMVAQTREDAQESKVSTVVFWGGVLFLGAFLMPLIVDLSSDNLQVVRLVAVGGVVAALVAASLGPRPPGLDSDY